MILDSVQKYEYQPTTKADLAQTRYVVIIATSQADAKSFEKQHQHSLECFHACIFSTFCKHFMLLHSQTKQLEVRYLLCCLFVFSRNATSQPHAFLHVSFSYQSEISWNNLGIPNVSEWDGGKYFHFSSCCIYINNVTLDCLIKCRTNNTFSLWLKCFKM